ncbi:MAG: hypothetical protein H7A51_11680 [Akkermansiaceae bacterium]|nr:hypothetical protein [Akkermansiaceae bacterium]
MKIQIISLLLFGVHPLTQAETLKWNVRAQYGMTAGGIGQAVKDAKSHFNKSPNDVIMLEFDKGTFSLEDNSDSMGTIDLSGVKPGPEGRLVFQGKGMDETVLVFGDNKHAIFGRDVYRVTFADMHMTRKNYTVSQGLVIETSPGKVMLEIQRGFPTPAMIFNPQSDQGRYLRRYTNSRNDPHLIEADNHQIPWVRARHLRGRLWEIEFKRKSHVANYPKGALIGIKSKHGGQTYWLSKGSDFIFNSVKWTQKTRGVFRGGFQKVQILHCVTDRSPPINGQTPCLAAPGGGPQIGQPNDPTSSGHLVNQCRFIASGDDAVAFFNSTGIIRGCYIRDAFCRGILVANGPATVLEKNTLIRCPVQNSKDHRFHEKAVWLNNNDKSRGK